MTHIGRTSAHGFLLLTDNILKLLRISQEFWYYMDLVGRAGGPGLLFQCLLEKPGINYLPIPTSVIYAKTKRGKKQSAQSIIYTHKNVFQLLKAK